MPRSTAPGRIALSVSLLLALGACSRQPAPPATAPGAAGDAAGAPTADAGGTTPSHADAPGIDWFEGGVDQAFAAAAERRQPVLLYWGAKWCPPCQQLKSTVFSRPDFMEKSKQFVPVYLDGDDPGAQKWGEEFRVTGYPTMVVLDAERREITRIAGSLDLTQYAQLLDGVLSDLRPVGQLLEAAARGEALSTADCGRLGYNAWALETSGGEEQTAVATRLSAAIAACPADAAVERARLQVQITQLLSAAEAKALEGGSTPSPLLAATTREVVRHVTRSPELARRLADSLLTLGAPFFRAALATGASRETLGQAWSSTMRATMQDPAFPEADRIDALASQLVAAKALSADGQVPAPLAGEARAHLDRVLAAQHAPYVRSGILNSALGIYDLLGENEKAYALVQAEMPKATTPFYYATDLADLAEKLGRRDEAVKWLEMGYRESKGPATRFQWGYAYASGLLRLVPDDVARIEAVSKQVLSELDGPNRIYRRARLRLERFDRDLRSWNEAAGGRHEPLLRSLRSHMQGICRDIPAGESARASCDAFLAPRAAAKATATA